MDTGVASVGAVAARCLRYGGNEHRSERITSELSISSNANEQPNSPDDEEPTTDDTIESPPLLLGERLQNDTQLILCGNVIVRAGHNQTHRHIVWETSAVDGEAPAIGGGTMVWARGVSNARDPSITAAVRDTVSLTCTSQANSIQFALPSLSTSNRIAFSGSHRIRTPQATPKQSSKPIAYCIMAIDNGRYMGVPGSSVAIVVRNGIEYLRYQ